MMKYPERRSIRLPGYDYNQSGYYFITLCSHERECLFGEIVRARRDAPDTPRMVLNDLGNVVENVWETLPEHHSVELDTFQIMPNHVHFIIIIVGAPRWGARRINNDDVLRVGQRPTPTLGIIINVFKMICTKQIKKIKSNNIFFRVWQRNYYERIIRNEKELNAIREYIGLNPSNWDKDRNNPQNFIL